MAQMAKNYWAQVPLSQCGTFQTKAEANDRLFDLIADPRNADSELGVFPCPSMKWTADNKGGADMDMTPDGWMIARRFKPEVWEERQRKLREIHGPNYGNGPSWWDEYQRRAKASPTCFPMLDDCMPQEQPAAATPEVVA